MKSAEQFDIKLTEPQKKILKKIRSGDVLFWNGYVPMVHIPEHCRWKGDEFKTGAENPIRSIRILMKEGLLELVKVDEGKYSRKREVKLSEKGKLLCKQQDL